LLMGFRLEPNHLEHLLISQTPGSSNDSNSPR
jgi:hypothetical protein